MLLALSACGGAASSTPGSEEAKSKASNTIDISEGVQPDAAVARLVAKKLDLKLKFVDTKVDAIVGFDTDGGSVTPHARYPPPRPRPDCLMAPTSAGALDGTPWLMPTVPVWRRSATLTGQHRYLP